MNKLEQAARQALGALVRAEAMYGQPNADIQTALREALAQPQGEWVAWLTRKFVDNFAVDGYETCLEGEYGCFPVYTTPPSVEAAIEATKEKVAKFFDRDKYHNFGVGHEIAAAIRSMK
jgi:hypothetical protein